MGSRQAPVFMQMLLNPLWVSCIGEALKLKAAVALWVLYCADLVSLKNGLMAVNLHVWKNIQKFVFKGFSVSKNVNC